MSVVSGKGKEGRRPLSFRFPPALSEPFSEIIPFEGGVDADISGFLISVARFFLPVLCCVVLTVSTSWTEVTDQDKVPKPSSGLATSGERECNLDG